MIPAQKWWIDCGFLSGEVITDAIQRIVEGGDHFKHLEGIRLPNLPPRYRLVRLKGEEPHLR